MLISAGQQSDALPRLSGASIPGSSWLSRGTCSLLAAALWRLEGSREGGLGVDWAVCLPGGWPWSHAFPGSPLPWFTSTEPAGRPACPGYENHLGSFLQMHIPAPAPETPPPVSSGLEPTSPAATLMILVGKGRRDISGHTRPGHQQRPPPWVSLTQPLVPAPPQGGQHPPPVSVWYLWSGQPWAPPLPSPRASAVTSTRRAPCGRSLSYTPA